MKCRASDCTDEHTEQEIASLEALEKIIMLAAVNSVEDKAREMVHLLEQALQIKHYGKELPTGLMEFYCVLGKESMAGRHYHVTIERKERQDDPCPPPAIASITEAVQ